MGDRDLDQTEPWARQTLLDRWRRMTPAEKLTLMSEHSIAPQQLSMAGLRRRFPSATEDEIGLRAAALRIGPEEFAQATGHRFSWE